MPSYSDALNAALIVKSNVEEASTVPIYYGIKVDTSLTPGTYTGDVLYTVLMDSSCLAYTVIFNANGGSGTMDNQSIMASTATKLTANTFTRSGYTFLGWSTDPSAATATYADEAEVTDLTTGGSSITLYAIWEQDVATMQSWKGCPSLSTNQYLTLKDARDNERYVVKKLADGKCWMVQNLRLVGERKLTSSDSDVSSDFNLTASTVDPNTTNWCTSDSSACNDKSQVYYVSSEVSDSTKSSYYGPLYNWYAATAGTGTYSLGSGEATSSICPKNWRLPTSGPSGEFATLDLAWGGTGENRSNANTYNTFIGAYTNGNNGGFSQGGYIRGSLLDVAQLAGYWSSTAASARGAYYLSVHRSYVMPLDNFSMDGKYDGHSVRCIAQDNYTISYSADGADGGEASKTSETVFQNNGTVNVTTPTAGTMVKSGYEFKGWALTSGATTATYQTEETVALSALLTAASAASQTTTPGSTITLYPVWEALPTAMQDFICSNLTAGTSTTLRDARDNQQYTVYRFPTDVKYAGTSTVANVAGKCIMTKDLNLGAVASVSGASSTIVANGTMALSPDDSGFTTPTGSGEDISVPTSNVTVSMTWSTTDSYSNKSYHANGTDNYAGRGYYSWGAAMVVCPKNWRLPTGDEYNNSGSWESSTTGISAVIKGNNAAESIANITSDPYSFTLGGHYNNGFGLATSNGAYWSSTQADSSNAYELGMILSYGLSRGSLNKRYGYAVRCISDPPVEDCSETVHPTTTTGCKMKDDNEWILGNNGGTVTWNNLCTSSDNCNSTTYCPSGYSIPAKAIYDTLISKQGSGNELYSALGITGERYFWSSTEQDAAVALGLRVHWSSASVVGALIGVDRLYKTYSVYVLCYKPS